MAALPRHTRLLCDGIGFTEGPIVDGDSHVLVTSMTRGLLYRIDLPAGGATAFAEVGGAPNGLARAEGGNLLVAQSGAHVIRSRSSLPVVPSIQRVRTDGGAPATELVLDAGVRSPSDCVVGPDGRLWFTDPGDHELEIASANGQVRAFDPVLGQLETVLDGLSFPNGLAFGVDGTQLYVAETALSQVRRFEVGADGSVVADGWVGRLPHGRPDGVALDHEGWLWVAGSVGANVVAFDAQGDVRADWRLGAGRFVTSLCFAGPALETLIITSPKGGRVLAAPAVHPGLPLPVARPSRSEVHPRR